MSLYSVIFNRHEKVSSDAAVSSEPTETSVVVGPLHQADIATVEADSPADAEHAVRVAYSGSTSFVHVVDHEHVTVAPFEDEQAKAREDAKQESTEPVASTESTEPVDPRNVDEIDENASTPAEKVSDETPAENTKQEPVPVTVENQPVETV